MDERNRDRSSKKEKPSGLGGMAQNIKPTATWENLHLPQALLSQLKEICGQAKCDSRIFGDRKLPRSKGLSVVFSGAAGTAKTIAAEVIAKALHKDLYMVNLAAVVSKYIGETEKNLNMLFDVAEQSGAILFFDEADTLFGKRSEVKDSHDRFANIEISYLLQRIEGFSGMAILATNVRKNYDEIVSHGARFIVEFPPSRKKRARVELNA